MIIATAKTEVPPRRLSVLFAEDEVLLRLLVTDVLRENGFEVFEAKDAKDAITILKATPVDVVVTDMHMRDFNDGMHVAKYVHEHCPGVSLILAAATVPVSVSPFDAFFIKPYEPEHIVLWIRHHHTNTQSRKSKNSLA